MAGFRAPGLYQIVVSLSLPLGQVWPKLCRAITWPYELIFECHLHCWNQGDEHYDMVLVALHSEDFDFELFHTHYWILSMSKVQVLNLSHWQDMLLALKEIFHSLTFQHIYRKWNTREASYLKIFLPRYLESFYFKNDNPLIWLKDTVFLYMIYLSLMHIIFTWLFRINIVRVFAFFCTPS